MHSDIYTEPSAAVSELHSRRNNPSLMMQVCNYHASKPPEFLCDAPAAYFVRAIIAADNELSRFLKMSESLGLMQCGLELLNDRYTGVNIDKKGYFTLPFYRGHQERNINVVGHWDDGVRLADVICRNGMTLIEFHHALLRHAYPTYAQTLRDMSLWAGFGKDKTPFDYVRYLSLFVTHGVLFESFREDEGQERQFMQNRVLPAIETIVNLFGVAPLIVKLFADDEVADPHWWRYPPDLYPVVKDLLNRQSTNSRTLLAKQDISQ